MMICIHLPPIARHQGKSRSNHASTKQMPCFLVAEKALGKNMLPTGLRRTLISRLRLLPSLV